MRFVQGERAEALYIVESGVVRTSAKIRDNGVLVDTFSRGSCLDWSVLCGEDDEHEGVSLVDAVVRAAGLCFLTIVQRLVAVTLRMSPSPAPRIQELRQPRYRLGGIQVEREAS